ncbi:MAG: hypothetical protein LQ337_002836 [Flavoplaca oasis]|nr:MAG: hypothetical protein LQ337_002836 [Flavoplaca oasis]
MGASMELHTVNAQGSVDSKNCVDEVGKTPHVIESELPSAGQRDAQALARLGKKPVLKRRFSFIAMLGFTCTVLVTWEVIPIIYTTGLTNGGTAGFAYSYLFALAGSLSLFTVLGEMASIAPTSGGQYHWTFMLAPVSCRKFFSYIMGWLVICGWQALVASSAYLSANLILALVTMNNPAYTPTQWQGTLLYWALMGMAILGNLYSSTILPKVEFFVLALHILGFFAFLIPMVYMSPQKNTSTEVWTEFNNGGDWPTMALSVCVGLIGSVFANNGTDCAVHMAEETKGADFVIPWCVVATSALNGMLGLGTLLSLLYVTTDIEAVIESPTGQLGFPFMQVVLDSVGSYPGATVMISIVIAMFIFAVIAFLATASRIVFAFGRDKGLPFWQTMAKVHPKTAIPNYAIYVLTGVACLVGIINIGSATAFNIILSIGISSLYSSYTITEALLLWRRVRGDIRKPSEMAGYTWQANELVWGPFHIPGVLGIALNAWAVCYGTIVIIFCFFPSEVSPDAAHMNWACLITAVVIFFAVAYYLVYAKKVYQGPVVEISPYQIS